MLGILPIPAGGTSIPWKPRISGPPFLVNPSIILNETPFMMLEPRPRGPRTERYSVVSFTLPDIFTERE